MPKNPPGDTRPKQEPRVPIRGLPGKLQAAGALLTAVSVAALLSGYWWGAAILFPSVILLLAGWLI